LTIIPMKFQLLHIAVKGTLVVSLNTVTHAVHIRLLARQIHTPHHRRHSPRSPSPLSSRRSPALLQPHRSLRDDGDEDVVTSVRTYVFPANLIKTVDADPLTSSLATTTSRPPQATSRRGSGPFDHHENNYVIRNRG
jgi:hypothetical protein